MLFPAFFLEDYEIKIEKKRQTTAVRSTQDLPGRAQEQEHPRNRVAAVAARRDMNRPERFIAPLRPCKRTCASQTILVPSFSIPPFSLFLPSAARIPVPLPNRIPRQKYKDYFHASRGANRVADEIGISDRFSSENKKPQIRRISRQEKHFGISMERRAKKDLKM